METPLVLSSTTLAAIAARQVGSQVESGRVTVPRYDRGALVPRIVHIGVGGFHRAHLALYTDDLAGAGSDWGIRGLGLLAADAGMAEALGAQDHLYTLIERGSGAPSVRVVGSIVDYRWCHEDLAEAVSQLADPEVAIVSLTVTEAGYLLGPEGSTGTFDVLAAALQRRRGEGRPPISVLSCDNVPANGDVARQATLTASARLDPSLADWVDEHCTFPSSMVDRITPVTSDEDRTWLRATVGVDDRWPVVCEPFRQWVIEDRFVCGRPSWEDVGALFTDRVHDWELYKLRLLNAGHSSLAYLAALAGLTFVDEAMARPEVGCFVASLLTEEAVPSLTEIPGHPRTDYVASVLERFANTGTRDQIARLCIDGTAKFPTFLIPTLAHQLARGGPVERATLALAGWARYLAFVPVADQAADASSAVARAHAARAVADPSDFLDLAAVFPPDLAANERFRAAFDHAWRRIGEVGPLGAMADIAPAS